jgi:hypothetical protein
MTTTEVLNAASNPALANKIAQEALQVVPQEVEGEATTIVIPSLPDTTVELPAGLYDSFDGTLVTTAEVRELTGADEEAIVKINEPGKALFAILERATVSVGEQKATKEILNRLLAGDREAILLAIRIATFGPEITLESVCSRCPGVQNFTINLLADVEMKQLSDKVADRYFTLKLKAGDVQVQLPTGDTQNKLINSPNKNSAELDTILLANCVTDIAGQPVLSEASVRGLGIKDRREILEEIAKRNPGPQLSEIKKACGECGQEVELPLTLAELFQS